MATGQRSSTVDPIDVSCNKDGQGWLCIVRVGARGGTTEHEVTVSNAELDRFAPAATEPVGLVERSFRFLLERESRESILRRFALSEIERYFPEYPALIR